MYKLLIENAPALISVADMDLRYQYFNPAFRNQMRIPPDAAPQGFTIADMSPPEMAEPLRQLIPQIIEQGSWSGRSVFRRQDGSIFPGDLAVFVMRDQQGNPEQFIAIATDASEQVAAEEDRAALQQQLIDAQRDALRELSTPLIPISDEVVIMPLIGSIDSGRAQMIMETLLEGVAQHQAQLVILDITGVMVVDTQVAQAFIQAAQAVRLLGAQVMLTGIQPQIAQTLVHLGVDLSGLQTEGSLQAGIATALRRQAARYSSGATRPTRMA
jgi:rsbT co-antagonist protein RsbR